MYMPGMPPSIMIGSLIFMGIGALVQMMLKKRFTEYSSIPLRSGLTGREVAEKMLRENGINDVQVVSVAGMLTDHYDPTKKTVNLSEPVYNTNSVAAAAVAAHECGHAIQHATAYQWLTMRSKLVPAVQISSRLVQWILLAGVLMITAFPQLLLVGIALFAVTTLFSVVTLPVEFDASNRALAWLEKTNVTAAGEEQAKAKTALKWAAGTYVVAAISSIFMLLQYVLMYMSARRNNE
jgi:uncharacterized protein